MRSINVATILAVLTACTINNKVISTAAETSTFCTELRKLITVGESGLRQSGIVGAEFSTPQRDANTAHVYLYMATWRLPGFPRCFIVAPDDPDRYTSYVCVATDASVSSDDEMRSAFTELKDKVSTCVVNAKWPGYQDEWGNSYRFETARPLLNYNYSYQFDDKTSSFVVIKVAIVRGRNDQGNPEHLDRIYGDYANAKSLIVEIKGLIM